MYIGSLLAKDSPVCSVYSYLKKGVSTPLPPDLYPDICSLDMILSGKGSLFCRSTTVETKVGWKYTSLLNTGIDIHVDLSGKCFIDQAIIHMEAGSRIKSASIYALLEGAYYKLGEHDSATLRISNGSDDIGGLMLSGDINVIAAAYAEKLIIRLEALYSNVILNGIEIFGAYDDKINIYPQPLFYKAEVDKAGNAGKIFIASIKQISADLGDNECAFAAALLKEKIFEKFGLEIPVADAEAARASPDGNALKELEGLKYLRDAGTIVLSKYNACGDELKGAFTGLECYSLEALDGRGILLAASDKRGLVYGVETLLMAVSADKKGHWYFPACTVHDKPYVEFRGVHLGLPARDQIPFFKRLLRNILAPMKYNTIFVEIAGGMRFDRHPEIHEAWVRMKQKSDSGEWPYMGHLGMVCDGDFLEKDEVASLFDYARQYGFEVIPEIQSLSHVQYLTVAFPEIAERAEIKSGEGDGEGEDLFKADPVAGEFFPSCYCASNEKSYEILFDVIDEIIETTKPERFVHMGHDEVQRIGVCRRCMGKDPAVLYANDVKKIYDYLAARGLRMMMWGDMLHTVTSYKTPPAIDMIPKDIVLLDFIWYFHFDNDIEKRFLENGFKVIMGNMYSSHYPRYEKRISRKGMAGAQVSTWAKVSEYSFAILGKMFDLFYSANMMWSEKYTGNARRAYSMISARLIWEARPYIGTGKRRPAMKYMRIPLGKPETVSKNGRFICSGYFGGEGIPLQISNPVCVKAPGTLATAGREAGSSSGIKVGGCFSHIYFLHASDGVAERVIWKPLKTIGVYEVLYCDGGREEIPIEYGGNIRSMSEGYAEPLPTAVYRHQGYTGTYLAEPYMLFHNGEQPPEILYCCEWLNPRRDAEISEILIKACGDADIVLKLYALTGGRISEIPGR